TLYDQDSNTKGVLLGDSTTLNLRSALYNTIQGDAIGVSGSFQDLAEIGITVGDGGKLVFNRDRFRTAYQQDPPRVADLVAARVLAPTQPGTIPGTTGVTFSDPNAEPQFTSQGLATQIENLADDYINSVTGVLTRRNQTINDQISLQQSRIA